MLVGTLVIVKVNGIECKLTDFDKVLEPICILGTNNTENWNEKGLSENNLERVFTIQWKDRILGRDRTKLLHRYSTNLKPD